MKLVAINENGMRMGEGHGRAKLSDEDVELIQSLLECRDMLIDEYTKVGLTWGFIRNVLAEKQLSYRGIAVKFEISKSHVRHIANGTVRARAAVGWKRAV
jgi:hypothetical protein